MFFLIVFLTEAPSSLQAVCPRDQLRASEW